ncbi:hypothetical protein DSO57_1024712 [Entomophthora muscae]|nr:hypothetical protein DSO57_1024712 [Entomophthora muscae]
MEVSNTTPNDVINEEPDNFDTLGSLDQVSKNSRVAGPRKPKKKVSSGSLSKRSLSEKASLSSLSFDSTSEVNLDQEIPARPRSPTGSATDIRSLLIKAYDVIAEKEQELDQAFKVRRAIMDENTTLKSECETLKENMSSFPLPSNPGTLNQSLKNQFIPSESQSPKLNSPNRNRFSRRSFVSRYDEDSITELENMNVSLQKRLDAALAEKDLAEKNGRKETRSLLNEIELLKRELDFSGKKIKELEETNKSLNQKRPHTPHFDRLVERRSSYDHPPLRSNSVILSHSTKNQDVTAEVVFEQEAKVSEEKEKKELSLRLLENIGELDKVNRALAVSKREAEEQVKSLQLELEGLRVYVAELERSFQQSEQNQYIIDQQAKQISELMGKLEQRQGGLLQQFLFSPRSSVSSIATAFNATAQRTPSHTVRMVHNDNRFNSAKGHRRTASASSATVQHQPLRRTLLTELEGEFYRHFSGSAKQLAIADWVQNSQDRSLGCSPNAGENELSDLEEHFEEEGSPPMTLELYSNADSLACPPSKVKESFPPQCNEKDIIPHIPRRPTYGPVGIVNTVRRCAHAVWKWCRFMALLFAAVGVAFYRGPDSDIADYYYD